ELVELGLVLGAAQALQILDELALLLLEPANRLGAIVVERLVAARARGVSRPAAPVPAAAGPVALVPHLPGCGRRLVVPAARPTVSPPGAQPAAQRQIDQECQADGPVQDEAEDRRRDPASPATHLVHPSREGHPSLRECKSHSHRYPG